MGGAIITVSSPTKEGLKVELEKAVAKAARILLLDVRGYSEAWYDEEEKVWKQAVSIHS